MITVVSTSKPPQVSATAWATVKVEGEHIASEVIDAGLTALGETRARLYGFGIEKHHATHVVDATVRVYAFRD